MSLSYEMELTGNLIIGRTSSGGGQPTAEVNAIIALLSANATCSRILHYSQALAAVTNDPVDFGGITSAKFLYLNTDAAITYRENANITYDSPVHGTLIKEYPTGTPLTALKLSGTGNVEIVLAE